MFSLFSIYINLPRRTVKPDRPSTTSNKPISTGRRKGLFPFAIIVHIGKRHYITYVIYIHIFGEKIDVTQSKQLIANGNNRFRYVKYIHLAFYCVFFSSSCFCFCFLYNNIISSVHILLLHIKEREKTETVGSGERGGGGGGGSGRGRRPKRFLIQKLLWVFLLFCFAWLS